MVERRVFPYVALSFIVMNEPVVETQFQSPFRRRSPWENLNVRDSILNGSQRYSNNGFPARRENVLVASRLCGAQKMSKRRDVLVQVNMNE